MGLNNVSAAKILQNKGVSTRLNTPDIRILAAELRATLENNIDSSVKYGAVAAAIKGSIFVHISSAYTASIVCNAIKPSIYNSVGLNGGSVNLTEAYNYGSAIHGNPYFFRPGSGGFYLKSKPGFAVHEAGHFLEKTAAQFMATHPDCTVSVS